MAELGLFFPVYLSICVLPVSMGALYLEAEVSFRCCFRTPSTLFLRQNLSLRTLGLGKVASKPISACLAPGFQVHGTIISFLTWVQRNELRSLGLHPNTLSAELSPEPMLDLFQSLFASYLRHFTCVHRSRDLKGI